MRIAQFIVICLFMVTEARVVPGGSGEENGTLWEPDGQERHDWMMRHGLKVEELYDISKKVQQVRILQATVPDGDLGNPVALEADHPFAADDPDDPNASFLIDNCIFPTSEQLDAILAGIHREMEKMREGKEKEKRRRFRRKFVDAINIPYRMWANPIIYIYDGEHNAEDRKLINSAFLQWEDNTCMRFQEISSNAYMPSDANHVLLTKQPGSCFSFVGRVSQVPQQLNLGSKCLKHFGTPVHEIGHMLGLWHEHQRWDRDEYIRILNENVRYYESQFWRRWTIHMDIPYDTTSVMHYGPKDGSYSGGRTMETVDSLQQLNLGQRVGLSFLDAKTINRAYCSETCASYQLLRECHHGGYQDPKNCSQCRCPDGFGGQYCERQAPPRNTECGGLLDASTEPQYIQSPGYEGAYGNYENWQECSWVIRAPPGYKVKLTFEGSFGLYCYQFETCFHWVEIKYASSMEVPGGRMCCYKRPERTFISNTELMAVIFRSNYTTKWVTQRIGFRARIVAEAPEDDLHLINLPQETPREEEREVDLEIPTTTTTTEEPRTSTDPPGTFWGPWGRCQNHECKCGGCSFTTRHRICGTRKCTNHLQAHQTKACDRKCRTRDKYLLLRWPFSELPCPVCCEGFKQKDDTCVPNDQ